MQPVRSVVGRGGNGNMGCKGLIIVGTHFYESFCTRKYFNIFVLLLFQYYLPKLSLGFISAVADNTQNSQINLGVLALSEGHVWATWHILIYLLKTDLSVLRRNSATLTAPFSILLECPNVLQKEKRNKVWLKCVSVVGGESIIHWPRQQRIMQGE